MMSRFVRGVLFLIVSLFSPMMSGTSQMSIKIQGGGNQGQESCCGPMSVGVVRVSLVNVVWQQAGVDQRNSVPPEFLGFLRFLGFPRVF